jgi:hypothetical protein
MIRSTMIIARAAAVAVTLSALPAHAQNARSFVSGHGSDANACTLAAPCRTFQHAHDQTNAGGEITVLDPAGYGSLAINKAISIINDGVGEAGVQFPTQAFGILITAGANDAVTLRGLSIDGSGSGVVGIQFNSGKSLTIENCVVRHVVNDGINFTPGAAGTFLISNSVVSDNGLSGIVIGTNGSGAVTAVLNRVEVNNNAYQGLYIEGDNGTGTLNVVVYDSIAANNINAIGFYASSTTGRSQTTLTVFHSLTADNAYGVLAFGVGATVRVAHSMVTGNTHGWLAQAGGVLKSYGDNYIDGNGDDETAPPGTIKK